MGHEESDASNYANWSVDYLKVYILCLFKNGEFIDKVFTGCGSTIIATFGTVYPEKSGISAWEML